MEEPFPQPISYEATVYTQVSRSAPLMHRPARLLYRLAPLMHRPARLLY
ncbi:hypothetical protein [Nostoc sp. DSM 114160]